MGTNTGLGSSKSGGLLLAAHRAAQIEAITWTEIPFGDLVITVAEDAVKGPLGDRTGVRLPVTYEETVTICRELGCVTPTQAMCDAMFARAKTKLQFVPLVRTAADSMKMGTVDFTLRFHEGVEKQLAAIPPGERGLVFGAWKLWILHPRLVERGAVNYGFWDKSRKPPRPIQTVGGRHDARHYDYSQVLHLVKRTARRADTGEPVDLLDYIAEKDRIPARFLQAFKEAPDTGPVAFTDEPVHLVDALQCANVNVEAVEGWETRGRPGFEPQGIMVHHTAGPKKGDAPTLRLCIDGRKDPKNPANNLSGPLCHIVLARSGKAYVIAASTANHAGRGAQEVLDLVKRDEPVTGDAREHGYKDSVIGNAYFYGIEVENSGAPDDPYPDAQIEALGNVCAAICQAHGWSANRVIHHRQWTSRKVDMSYRADLPSIVAQMMHMGVIHFAVSFEEGFEPAQEAAPGPGEPVSFGEDAEPAQEEVAPSPDKRAAPRAKKKAPAKAKKKARAKAKQKAPAKAKQKAPAKAKKKAPAKAKKPGKKVAS